MAAVIGTPTMGTPSSIRSTSGTPQRERDRDQRGKDKDKVFNLNSINLTCNK